MRRAVFWRFSCSPLRGTKSCENGGAGDAGPSPRRSSPDKQAAPGARARRRQNITLGDYTAALEHMDQFDRLRYQSPERRKSSRRDDHGGLPILPGGHREGLRPGPPRAAGSARSSATRCSPRRGKDAPTPAPDPGSGRPRVVRSASCRIQGTPERRRVSVVTSESSLPTSSPGEETSPVVWGDLMLRSKSIDPQARANVPIDFVGDLGIVSPPTDPRGENPRVPQEVRAACTHDQRSSARSRTPSSSPGGKFTSSV